MPASPVLRSEPAAKSGDREIIATRVFDAPREVVFSMWTDPHHLSQWWGPHGFTTTIYEMDVRVGGQWRLVMRGPDGTDYDNRSVYTEVLRPERLAYSHQTGPIFDSFVTFEDLDGKRTLVTVRMVFESGRVRDDIAARLGAVEGLDQTLTRLERKLAERGGELVISRVFDAPRDVVFDAWTKESHLEKWWAPKSWTTVKCKVDLRPGGMFLYGMQSQDGKTVYGRGIYKEVTPPERIVYSDSFSDENGNAVDPATYFAGADQPQEMLVTVTFTEREGKTIVTLRHAVPESAGDRGGIAQGWGEMFDRLAAELA
jgi:uncharacterized protein YndB with AHSA1/START domain